jgi:nucleotide-binding universal stress UspA family protein
MLLRESTIPVLAIGPNVPESTAQKLRLKHILVPLDGEKTAEAALPVAKRLAADLNAHISVVRVVPRVADFSYQTQTAIYDPKLDKILEQRACETSLPDRRSIWLS